MSGLPNLRHLIAALEVTRQGSINSAAKRVHLSQSAVTQGLSKLESALGTELFTRSATGLFPTESGRRYLFRVERALRCLGSMEQVGSAGTPRKAKRLYRLLTTTQLRAFVTVVECGSYSRAAHLLGLTQPTVHRSVRELESVFGQQLFHRSPQGVEPTWRARQMARHASLFFSEISQGAQEINELKGQMSGSLSIGSLPLARTRIVPHTVTRLLEEYPESRVRIIDGPYEEQLHGLLHGQIDVIVGALRSPAPSPDVTQELLFSDPLYVVVRADHRLSKRQTISADELSRLDWIAPRENTPAREAFCNFFEKRGLKPPEHVIECSSLVATRGLLIESDRAALLPAKQVEVDADYGILAVNARPLEGTSREIGITIRSDWKPTTIQGRFLELLRNYAGVYDKADHRRIPGHRSKSG